MQKNIEEIIVMNTRHMDEHKLQISYPILLAIYSIIPLSVLFFLFDKYLNSGSIGHQLPVAPESIFLLGIFLGTPHIMASNIIMMSNKEYFGLYKWRVLGFTLLVIAFFAIASLIFNDYILFAIVATATIVHVIKQQVGVSKSAARVDDHFYQVWGFTLIAIGVVLYNSIFLGAIFTAVQKSQIKVLLISLNVLLLLLTVITFRNIQTKMGQKLLLANTSMAIVSSWMYFERYYFLAVLSPRLIHDVTAFCFYIVHDYNRHKNAPQNWIYSIANKLRVNAFVVVPIIAIALTFVLSEYGDGYFNQASQFLFNRSVPAAISLGFIGYLSLLHYYAEAFTWKKQSPYKKYISFKAMN